MNQGDDIDKLRKKSVRSVFTLVGRHAAVQGAGFLSTIILARLLVPETFGIYAIVLFVTQFISSFSEMGLTAALLRKEHLTDADTSSAFWFQAALAAVICLLLLLAASLVVRLYPALSADGEGLLRAMAIAFFLTSLRTVPVMLMERGLSFQRVALLDIAENVVFHIVAIVLAVQGFGAWSFGYAALGKAVAGLFTAYRLEPWRPRMMFDSGAIRTLLPFGVTFQLKDILGFVKEALTPGYVGALFGAGAVGYLGWARSFAFVPLIFPESFGRVAFPAFSRIRGDRVLLAKAIESAIRAITFVMFPVVAIIVAFAPDLVRIIFTDKWLPALPAFYFFCMSPAGIGIFLPLHSAFMAAGTATTLLRLVFVITVIEWTLGIVLTNVWGFVGVAMTQVVTVPLFTIINWLLLQRMNIRVRVVENVAMQLIISIGIVGLLRTLRHDHLSLPMMVLFSVCAMITYGLIMFIFRRSMVVELFGHLKSIFPADRPVPGEGRL